MEELNLSAHSVQKILQNDKWVDVYRKHLDNCHSQIIESRFPMNIFPDIIKPQLVKTLKIDHSNQDVDFLIRTNLQKWSLLSCYKYQFLIRLQQLIPLEIDDTKKIRDFYSDVPLGPIEHAIFEKLSEDNRIKWSEGSKMVYFKDSSLKNFIGIFVSEEFFITEAMCRVLLIGTCFEFALKSILPNTVLQHDEIHKTLKRLGSKKHDKVACKMCGVNKECIQRDIFLDLANFYCLLYHLRVIKDYKMDFFDNPDFTHFLLNDFFTKGFEITCNLENMINKNFAGYWSSPDVLTLSKGSREIHQIIQKNSKNL